MGPKTHNPCSEMTWIGESGGHPLLLHVLCLKTWLISLADNLQRFLVIEGPLLALKDRRLADFPEGPNFLTEWTRRKNDGVILPDRRIPITSRPTHIGPITTRFRLHKA